MNFKAAKGFKFFLFPPISIVNVSLNIPFEDVISILEQNKVNVHFKSTE
jgi:hypothetical protein